MSIRMRTTAVLAALAVTALYQGLHAVASTRRRRATVPALGSRTEVAVATPG